MSILFPLLLLIVSVALIARVRAERRVVRVLLLALGIRLFVSILNVVGLKFPFSDTTDVAAFLAHAQEGTVDFDVSQSFVWGSIIGVINMYTGDVTYSPLIINSVAGTCTVLYGYRIAMLLTANRGRAFCIAVLLTLLPPLIFTSASYLREAITTVFFTMFAYYLLEFGTLKNVPPRLLLKAFLAGSLAALFHGAFVLLPVFLLLYMALKLISNAPTPRALLGYSALAVALIGLFVLFSSLGVGASKAGVLYSNSADAIYEGLTRVIARGMTMEYMEVLPHSPALFALLALFKFLFSPMFTGELRAFDMLRWPIVVYAFFSILNIGRRIVPYPFTGISVAHLVLFAVLIVYCILFSIGSLDPDTAFRHYLKLLPVILAAGAPLFFLLPRKSASAGLSHKQ
jgi:hypothetical protein